MVLENRETMVGELSLPMTKPRDLDVAWDNDIKEDANSPGLSVFAIFICRLLAMLPLGLMNTIPYLPFLPPHQQLICGKSILG